MALLTWRRQLSSASALPGGRQKEFQVVLTTEQEVSLAFCLRIETSWRVRLGLGFAETGDWSGGFRFVGMLTVGRLCLV